MKRYTADRPDTSRAHKEKPGIAHGLLAIGDLDELLSHPVIGMSWEGFVVQVAPGITALPLAALAARVEQAA